MIDISIINNQDYLEINEELENIITDLINLSLESEKVSGEGEVSILFTDDKEIHELNKTHRDIDKSTDVLSFPQYDSKDDINTEMYFILGDIVISTETAKRQSVEYDHSLNREIGFLVVHSILHLLGYDHINEDEGDIMRSKEKKILNKYNLTRSKS